MCIWFDVYMCNFDVYVFGSMYKCVTWMYMYAVYMHAVWMYVCVISNCMNAVRYIYL